MPTFKDSANPGRVLIASAAADTRAYIGDVAKAAGLRAVGFVREPEQLVRRTQLSTPDVLVMDGSMYQSTQADLNGLRKGLGPIRILLCRAAPPLSLSSNREPRDLDGTLDFGAVDDSAGRLRQMLDTPSTVPAVVCKPGPVLPSTTPVARKTLPPDCLVIGSSTGGPVALMQLLKAIPGNFPLPIAIVQHMPPGFTRMLAERLNAECPLNVVEAEQNMVVAPGTALIAPGGYHLKLNGNARNCRAELNREEPENSCRPAVDVLFRSSAAVFGGRQMALVLTGMGRDGLAGATHLHGLGSRILVQDASTSTVWGMPGAIAQAGIADDVLPIDQIASYLMRYL